eukprot:CAMPEP_0196781382 /NCGR_PEP_ID=MMETSP1104-20130614/9621_1 /TAXON_ID=33652 /ORGANISM="Cafeteria sp., Strain Caron Lab Isolate" /LENGTH=44 /DNA_ID= /DNA_START= /DNA_END= /DNA_ORIENTATION=
MWGGGSLAGDPSENKQGSGVDGALSVEEEARLDALQGRIVVAVD